MRKFLYTNILWLLPLCGVVIFGLGIETGRTIGQTYVVRPQVLRESGYKYISPVLLCNTASNQTYNEDTALHSQLSAYLDKLPEENISVYFLQLKSGGMWAGVNENDSYAPASMLKVPTMLAVLKYADSHSDFLSKKIYYDGSFDDNKAEYFKPQKSIKAGYYYTVDELLTYTIAYSDNNAVRLLNNSIDEQTLQSIYVDLGIQLPADPTENIDFMSAKTYSLFLRVLYNSTYLSRETSQKALALMAAPDFPLGLQAGVPTNVEVAQKFGERQIFLTDGTLSYRELHDCGIVYSPNSPYVLCVMTRGKDFESLATVLHEISKMVYDHVTQQISQ